MEDPADPEAVVGENGPSPFLGERTHTHDKSRPESFDGATEGVVTDLQERTSVGCGQLVRRQVPTAVFEKLQRAVIGDEEGSEECLRCSEYILGKTPEPAAGNLAAWAIETENRPFGVFVRRSPDLRFQTQPVPDGCDLAEGHTRLRHPPRSRVHPEKDDFSGPPSGALEILAMHVPSIVKRVVDMGNRVTESERVDLRPQASGNLDKIRRTHGRGL